MTEPTVGAVGQHYRSSRRRLEAILTGLDRSAWDAPAPACPGWRVRDVLAHLVGVIEDAAAGRLTGPPAPHQTAAEVGRHRDDAPMDLLRTWTAMAPTFEVAIGRGERWPAFLDVLSHEHDIRGALGLAGEREHPDVRRAAALLTAELPESLTIDIGATAGGMAGATAPPIRLRTTDFEVFRLRLGRRSRRQVRALDWTGDPEPVLDHLFIFGPATTDLTE